MANLTKTFIEAVEAPESGQRIYPDDKQKGLGLRVTAHSKAFVFERRFRGKSRRLTIGQWPSWSVDMARKRAREWDAMMDRGVDPAEQERAAQRRSKTLKEVFEAFMDARQLKDRTAKDYRRYFEVYLGGIWEQRARKKTDQERQSARTHQSWHNLPVTEIDAGMVARRHIDISRTSAGKSQANACMRMLRAVLTWARADLGKAVLPENAVHVLTEKHQWFQERPRQNYIQREDLAAWFIAVRGLQNTEASQDRETIATFLQFVLLTGARRGEAERLQWSDVDFDVGTITFRDTKNGEDRVVPLTRFAGGLLRAQLAKAPKRGTGDNRPRNVYVFAATLGETGHIQEPRKALEAVAAASGIRHTLHDLRRTYATHLESLDVSLYALKRLLGHSDGRDVTARHYTVANVDRLRKPAQDLEDYMLSWARLGAVVKLPIARAA